MLSPAPAADPVQRAKVLGVAHLAVYVKDLDKARKFYEDFMGFEEAFALRGGMEAWEASGRALSEFETATIEDMAQWILSGERITVVDARDDHEWGAGHAPGAVHMYVPDVQHHAADIPKDAPVAVHCAAGYRAAIAASLIEQAGLTRIIHVTGEYAEWARLHLAQTVPA